jgi:hypothetical protein
VFYLIESQTRHLLDEGRNRTPRPGCAFDRRRPRRIDPADHELIG